MDNDYLTLKRASASRPSGEWNDDDFDVLADGAVVGRIFKVPKTEVEATSILPSLTARLHARDVVSFPSRTSRGRGV